MAVQYDRAMIELVREIRKHAPSDLKPAIKLANPDLLHELGSLFRTGGNIVLESLIKALFEKAGDEWTSQLTIHDDKKYITKIYRGTTQLQLIEDQNAVKAKSRQRIYRGQLVVD